MSDPYVLAVQGWLNQTYGTNANFNYQVTEDGQTGNQTIEGLIRALQVELSASVDGAFGPGTSSAFTTMFPDGLSETTYSETSVVQRITKILQGGFYCKGINPYAFDGVFSSSTTSAVQNLQSNAGLTNPSGIVDAIFFQALLNTDGFSLASNGDANIRDIQQRLNRKYYNTIGLIPTNGLYGRPTHMGIVKALQYEVGATIDGYFGIGTQRLCPVLQMYGNNNTNLVYILQYILYCSGFNPNGFDGAFGNGVKNAVTQFQNFVKLTADGICGQQTWASLMSSAGDTTRTVTACDTRFEITDDRAKLLVKNGYQIVGRYIVGGDFKELRANEPEVIFNNGLKFFSIFQENGTSESDFSRSKGISAAYRANLALVKHKIPKGATVYFAVDFDCLDYQITNAIIPYFQSIANYFNSDYNIGIYGTRNTCTRVCSAVSRVTSSFVADMSTGYSGNLSYFLPTNWNYDQICETTITDSELGSLDIDKVVYNGLIPAVSSLEPDNINPNSNTIAILKNLYDWVEEYMPGLNIRTKNIYVLQYLRCKKYAGTQYETLVSPISQDFIQFVENKSEYSQATYHPDNINIIDSEQNITIGIDHLAASTESIMQNGNCNKISDLTGWIGDLLSLLGELQDTMPGYEFSVDFLYNCIGGIGWSAFDYEDFIQDIDAMCIAQELSNQPIYSVIENYYGNGSKNRFNTFVSLRIQDDSPENRYQKLYNIIYKFTSKEEVLTDVLGLFLYSCFDEEIFGELAAEALARKLTELCN